MSNDADLKRELESEYAAALYWKHVLGNHGDGREGIIILAGDERVNARTLDLLPCLMVVMRYESMHIMSYDNAILEWAKGYADMESTYELCPSGYVNSFCHIQNALKLFDDIYINTSIDVEDADALQLEGCDGISLEDIICRVFFKLETTLVNEELRQLRKQILRQVKHSRLGGGVKIKWDEQGAWIPTEKRDYSSPNDFLLHIKRKLVGSGALDKKSRIIIYGNTVTAKRTVELFSDYRILCIADRNYENCERLCDDIDILSPDDAISRYDKNIRILVTLARFHETCEWLASIGYELGKQVFLLNYRYDITELPDSQIKTKLKTALDEGFGVYRSLRQKYPEEYLLLCPWNASGDVYINGLYLEEFLKARGIKEYRIVVCNLGAKKIAQLMSFEAEYITEEDAYALLTFARMTGFEKNRIININVNVKNQRVDRLFRMTDFNTFHQKLVFGTEVKKSVPRIRQNNADQVFEENKLIMGKTALIAPYSATLGWIEESICLMLVELLKDHGYSVCTNISGDEKPIPGTVGLFIPYDCVIDFVNKAGLFIGMRSGLCDIVSSTTAVMIVFYPLKYHVLFSLQRMALKTTNIYELVSEEETPATAVRKIDRYLFEKKEISIKQYNTEDIENAKSQIRRGASYANAVRMKNGLCRWDWVVFLFSDNEEINRYTLYYLPLLLKRSRASKAVIVSPKEGMTEIDEVREHCSIQYVRCTEEEMRDVCRYYALCREYDPDYFKARVIINGSPYPEDGRLLSVIGYNRITAKEYVALAIYRFDHIPDDKEVEAANQMDRPFVRSRADMRDLLAFDPDALIHEIDGGQCIYGEIRKVYPDERIYLVPYPGTGDMVIVGMYLRDRMQMDGVSSGVLVIPAKSCERIWSLMETETNLRGIVVLDGRPDAVKLLRFAKQIGYEKTNVVMLNDAFDLIDGGKMRGYKGLDFNTLFQKTVFFAENKHHGIALRSDSAIDLFERNDIRQGKTVLLSPYTKSMNALPMSFWERIAEVLISSGYDVVTNVSSTEQPVKATKGLMIPYAQLGDFLENCCAFIGIRSGLCDVIAGSGTKKIILYHPNPEHNTMSGIGFFGLENMEIGKWPLYEIRTDGEEEGIIDWIRRIVDDSLMDELAGTVRFGEHLCREMRRRWFQIGQEYLVFLFSRDEEINRHTIELLPILRQKENVTRFLLVTDNPDREDMIRRSVQIPYDLEFCTTEEAHAIGRYCTEISRGRKSAERTLINGTDDEEEYRYRTLIGENGINTMDVTALSIFDFDHVPGQSEVADALEYVPYAESLTDSGYDIEAIWETEVGRLEDWEFSLLEGQKIYNRIRAELPKTRLYMCTYPGSGDIFITGLYLRDRLQHDNVPECALVLASESSRKILELFDLGDIIRKVYVLRGRLECNKLLYYVRNMGFEKANAQLLNNDYGIIRLERLSGVKGIDFNTLFRKAVFFSDVKRVGADLRIENADAIFEKEGIRAGRTVLLAPYAATTEQMSEKIWEEIAHRLKERGYDVVTNVSGMTEHPVVGTRGISIPYAMIVDFLDKAGGFIGLRSGLCDIISGSTANKVIFYPSGMSFHFSTSLNYFSLEKMYNIQDHLTELEISEDQMEEILDRIIALFPE